MLWAPVGAVCQSLLMARSHDSTVWLGKRRDFVVAVDDWKGPVSSREDSPVCYVGRVLNTRWQGFRRLLALLDEAGAAAWHAKDGQSLLGAPLYKKIFRLLDHGACHQVVWLADHGDVQSEAVRRGIDAVYDKAPHLDRDWPREHPYATSLLSFIVRVHDRITRFYQPAAGQISILVIADRMDWLASRNGPLCTMNFRAPTPEWSHCHHRVFVEVVSVLDKTSSEARPLLPLLGLVDSEAWALGRLQSTVLHNGDTVRNRLRSWRDTGSGDELFSDDDCQRMVANAPRHATHYAHFIGMGLIPWLSRDTDVLTREAPFEQPADAK